MILAVVFFLAAIWTAANNVWWATVLLLPMGVVCTRNNTDRTPPAVRGLRRRQLDTITEREGRR